MSTAREQRADPTVRLVGVSKGYAEGAGRRAVFRDLTVAFERGEFVAITGRSGSGKSTLLNLVSGIDAPDAGEVWIAGARISHLSEAERSRARREHVGFVYQFFNLIPTLTLTENLLLALELRGRLDRSSRARAAALLDEVGLADRGASFPDRLSGGEQQRAAIARALVHDPEIVLADEPTGNLDDETAARVVELFQRLLRPARKTLVLVTHSAELARIADRVFRVQDGSLAPVPGALRA